jgi:glycogen debranching enzyme
VAHDNSLIALGMRRYGFAAEAAALARDISRAASHFLLNQLPELYGGLQRDATSFPVQYLGLQQDAPRGKLYVDPALPDWLPDVTLTDLRLGRRRFDIRFWRDGKNTLFNVLTGKRDSVEWKSVALSASTVGG